MIYHRTIETFGCFLVRFVCARVQLKVVFHFQDFGDGFFLSRSLDYNEFACEITLPFREGEHAHPPHIFLFAQFNDSCVHLLRKPHHHHHKVEDTVMPMISLVCYQPHIVSITLPENRLASMQSIHAFRATKSIRRCV